MTDTMVDCSSIVRRLGPIFADRAAHHGDEDAFVAANYADLRSERFFSAMAPSEMGGGGRPHSEICTALRELAAYCPSTSLAVSMHQHLVAAARFNHMHGRPGRKLLEAVARDELILVSTGANDWLASSGRMVRVEGGFRLTARKPFASSCPAGGILVTSAVHDDPSEGPHVLHFPVPFSSEGVEIEEDWIALGMRGTGSHTIVLKNVFVPDDAIVLKRPRSKYHPLWNIVLVVALPLIMSVYIGIAETAARIAREKAAKSTEPATPYLLGEMQNALTTAGLAYASMMALCNDLDFEPSTELANEMLIRKTIAARTTRETVEKAMEALGGSAYFRPQRLERLLRDSYAAQFHPLAEKKQLRFTGRLLQGLDPVGELADRS